MRRSPNAARDILMTCEDKEVAVAGVITNDRIQCLRCGLQTRPIPIDDDERTVEDVRGAESARHFALVFEPHTESTQAPVGVLSGEPKAVLSAENP